jgi:GalNAc5-diNAcBac-PP-undecaprenol beta-1,3-glucosyltransferase
MEIAVIITTYNRSKLLRKAIESVLNQNFSQIIVVDDCSSDDTFNTVDFYIQKNKKLSYLKMDKNSGVNACRNRAIHSVFCDWVAFLDDDDEFVFDAFDIISNKIDTIPKNIDVLITHGPPYGILDKTVSGENVGCEDLLSKIQEIKPKFSISPGCKIFFVSKIT